MSIVNRMPALAAEAGNLLDGASPVPDFQMLRVEPHVDLLADQTTGNRVGVPPHRDHASGADSRTNALVALQPPRGERCQCGSFLRQQLLATGVPLAENLAEKSVIGCAVGEIAAPTQLQGLVDCLL